MGGLCRPLLDLQYSILPGRTVGVGRVVPRPVIPATHCYLSTWAQTHYSIEAARSTFPLDWTLLSPTAYDLEVAICQGNCSSRFSVLSATAALVRVQKQRVERGLGLESISGPRIPDHRSRRPYFYAVKKRTSFLHDCSSVSCNVGELGSQTSSRQRR